MDLDNAAPQELPCKVLEDGIRSDEDEFLESILALASEMLEESATDDLDVLNTAITVIREGLKEVKSTAVSNYPGALNELAVLLWRRYQQVGQSNDLDETIALRKQAHEVPHPQHNDRSASLYDLAIALSTRYERLGLVPDLEEAVSLHLQALEYRRHPHPDRQTTLDSLEISLSTLYQQRPAVYSREAIDFRNNFVELVQRFQSSSQIDQSDHDVAILLFRQGLVVFFADRLQYCTVLHNLTAALLARFEQGNGRQEDLEEAITLNRQALMLMPVTDPDRFSSLTNLANTLRMRFERGGGRRKDVEEAVSLHRQALALTPALHPDRSSSLKNLAITLERRFESEGGQQEDLQEAISLRRQALALTPAPHPGRWSSLNGLANTVRTWFQQGDGQSEDLDEAVSLLRQAVALIHPDHPASSALLSNLAGTLQLRLRQGGGQREDLEEAVSLHRQALALRHALHPDRPTALSNLATTLHTWFQEGGGQIEDLEEAISLHRQALSLMPVPHADRSLSLINLAITLQTRFEDGGGHIEDLAEAISLQRQALALQPAHHPNHCSLLNNLAGTLRLRFRKGGGQREDLEEALVLLKQVLALRPAPHPTRFDSLWNLASLYILLFSLDKNSDDFELARSLSSEAAHSASSYIVQTFRAAKWWAQEADKHDHPSALESFDDALRALPQLAAIHLNIHRRQNVLMDGSDGLARRAARCAIRAGMLGKAVEFLETGRGVFWSQMLHLRPTFEDLPAELGDKLRKVAEALEQSSHRNPSFASFSNEEKLRSEQEDSRLATLGKEWTGLLKEIRYLPGLDDFLLLRPLSSLQAALLSPVVLLIANNESSDCLVVTPTVVHHIPLPHLSNNTLQTLVRLISSATSGNVVDRSSIVEVPESNSTQELPRVIENALFHRLLDGEGDRAGKVANFGRMSADDTFRRVLKVLWDEVVKPVIDFLGFHKNSNDKPLLQWCPTGLFAFLPIHAAGRYEHGLSSDRVFDYAISSYTPTIGALVPPKSHSSTQPFRMMAVIQSETLPSTRKELNNIRCRIPAESLTVLGIPDAAASVKTVASQLSDASIVHFACHGIQDRLNPLASGLVIEGEILTISRIMQASIPHGSLAFLSVCETAMGDKKLPDEAMSLGASLLFSGFRRVVATMWRMRDVDGPIISDAFYEELFRGPDGDPMPEPDTSKSALALQVAVDKLRSAGAPFHAWVPFIHMGQ